MGQAFLVRRGGSGGKVELKVTKYASADALPKNGKEGSVAVITQASIGDIYIQPAAPSGVPVGSLFFASASWDATLLSVGTISFYSTGAFIRTDAAWVAVDTYIFRSGAWVLAPSGKLTEAGTDYTAYTGGFVARKISSKSDASATPIVPRVTINAENITIDTTNASGTAGVGMWCTDKMIDLTPYKTIVFEGTFSSNYTQYPQNFMLAAWSKIPNYYTNDQLVYHAMQQSISTTPIHLDVSNINVQAYIGIGLAFGKAVITRCYMIPKDV